MKKTIFLFCFGCFLTAAPMKMRASFISKPATSTSTVAPTSSEINKAIGSFHELSKKKQKERLKLAKETAKKMKSDSGKFAAADESTILLAILAILLPPLAVYLKEGDLTTNFWLSVILSLLFWFPGVIFALLVVLDVI